MQISAVFRNVGLRVCRPLTPGTCEACEALVLSCCIQCNHPFLSHCINSESRNKVFNTQRPKIKFTKYRVSAVHNSVFWVWKSVRNQEHLVP